MSKRRRRDLPARGQHGLVFRQTTIARSGPLPDPATLRQYEEMIPGAADRIINMAERDQQFIHAYQLRRQKGLFVTMCLGQVFGFSLGVAGLVAVVVFVLYDKPLAGLATMLLAVATLIGTAVWGRGDGEKK